MVLSLPGLGNEMLERVPNTSYPCLPEDIGFDQYRSLAQFCVQILLFTICFLASFSYDKCRGLSHPWFTLRVLQIQRERSGEGFGAIESDDFECRFAVNQFAAFFKHPGLRSGDGVR